MSTVSVMTTVHNERESLPELLERLTRVLQGLGRAWEIVVVDDGSEDGSAAFLAAEAAREPRLKVVELSRNFGQHAAAAAGFRHASGDAVVWMDADLQDVPEEIPRLLARLDEGYDVVYAVREHRQDPLFRRLNARAFFWLFEKTAGHRLPPGMSTFRVLSRGVVDAVLQMPEHSRFTAGIIAWVGFRHAAVPVRHDPRRHGRTSYSLWQLVRLSLDALISFSGYPVKLASRVGMTLSLASVVMGAYMIYRRLVYGFVVTGYASLIVSVLFLAGVQLLFLGIIGEYVARIFLDVQGRPLYVVRRRHNL